MSSSWILKVGDSFLKGSRHDRLVKAATYGSSGVAVLLIGIKMWAYWVTGSLSLQASLIDSCLDGVASLINMFAVHHALQPADDNHRFGHGKAESLAALGQSLLIAASAFWLLWEVYHRVLQPIPIENTAIGVWVMVASIFLTLFLVGFQRYVILKTRSQAIGADALHYETDILVNGSVILALMIEYYGIVTWIDELLGACIGAYILYSAWGIIRDSVNTLMDHECSDEIRQKILGLLENHPEILGYHDLRTRQSGSRVLIQVHIELDGSMLLRDAHRIAEDLEVALMHTIPNSEIIVHQDPQDE